MMKFEGSDGPKEEDYFSIFPIIDNAVPAEINENVLMEQEEQGKVVDQVQNKLDAHLPDEPIVHEQEDNQLVNQLRPDGAHEDIEEFFRGWENPPPNPSAAQLHRSLRTLKPTEEYRLFRGYPSSLPELLNKSETNKATCLSTKIFGKQDLTFQEALSSKGGELWGIAMDDEYASLKIILGTLSHYPLVAHQSNADGSMTSGQATRELRNVIRLDSSL